MQQNNKEKKGSAKDVFLHLFSMVTLYVSVISFLIVIFQIINITIPDVVQRDFLYYKDSAKKLLRGGLSFLVVMFPAYILSVKYLKKDYLFQGEHVGLRIRTWLTYLTLFLSSTLILFTLGITLNTYLEGEMTARFLLKVLSVFFVAISAGLFYLKDVRESPKKQLDTYLGFIVIIVGILTVILALVFGGSPKNARQVRFDEQRLQDLQQIESFVLQTWEQKNALPDSQESMIERFPDVEIPRDPETQLPYRYEKVSATIFHICATFSTERKLDSRYWMEQSRSLFVKNNTEYRLKGQSWDHPAGDHCFRREIELFEQPNTRNEDEVSQNTHQLIRLTSPKDNQTITSPLQIKGEARGSWFFEATFPIVLTDWDGRIIAQHYAQADGEWMTEEFVPFTATLDFETPVNEIDPDFMRRGSLILQKSNASGLPEHDDAHEITIYYSPKK